MLSKWEPNTVMQPSSSQADLARSTVAGDRQAMHWRLASYREQLKRMIAVRLDPRVQARVDPSDIVQDVLTEAAGRLHELTPERQVSIYPWLRQLACQRLIDAARRHIQAERRTVQREQRFGPHLADRSERHLVEQLITSTSSPSQRLQRQEIQQLAERALHQLSEEDREILVMRYLEQLKPTEIAEILGISDRTVRARHRRALEKMLDLLQEDQSQSSCGHLR